MQRFGIMAVLLGLLLALPVPAHADEVIRYGPAEAWVTPIPLPAESAKSPEDAEAPFRILLLNRQLNLTNEGDSAYTEGAILIQTPDGLDAGQSSISWNPETEDVTVHKLRIMRGKETLDLLANGQTYTILRRENNLEQSMLDGRLTGVIQPEDLRLGDILISAYTVRRHDPIMQGRSEGYLANVTSLPVERLYLRALWPRNKPLRYRTSIDFRSAKLNQVKEGSELIIDRTQIVRPKAPKQAPDRFGYFSIIEFGQFEDWQALSRMMAPYYEPKLSATSPLHAEIETLKALPDRKAQMTAALRLVQDHIRYVYIGLNQGSYIPAQPDETWTRRFGDCKGKTLLLLTLLRGLGIDAEPVLVATVGNDGLDGRLPTLGLFDHVMVRARLDGKTYWLDGTRSGDRNIDLIPIPEVNWALPIRAEGGDLVSVPIPPLERPTRENSLNIDASRGLDIDAPTTGEIIMRSDISAFRARMSSILPSQRDKLLRDYWKKEYDFIEPETVSLTFDEQAATATLHMTGKAKMDWDYDTARGARTYETDGYWLGWKGDLKRDEGLNSDAPVETSHPYFVRHRETIRLPHGGKGFSIDGKDTDLTAGGYHFFRRLKLEGDTFTLEASTRSLQKEVPLTEALNAQKPIRALDEEEVYLKAPANYNLTQEELNSIRAETPTTAEDYYDRGHKLFGGGEYEAALADFTAGLKLDPKSGALLTARGSAYLALDNMDAALKDFEQALNLNPSDMYALRGTASIYYKRKEYGPAIDLLLRVSQASPGDTEVLSFLAEVYTETDNREQAIKTLRKIVTLEPDNHEALSELGDWLMDCRGLANTDCETAKAEAVVMYSRAIAIKPTAWDYANRAQCRPANQTQEKLADIDAALALEPDSAFALLTKGGFYINTQADETALPFIDKAIELDPEFLQAYQIRKGVYERLGRYDLAIADADRLLKDQPDSVTALNNACWLRAISNRDLDTAATYCQRARELEPDNASALDTNGFLQLRLGNNAQALDFYEEALKKRANSPFSLYGRAIAHKRLGHAEEAQKDLEAARALSPETERKYESYGLMP